jgi:hypothetical protein
LDIYDWDEAERSRTERSWGSITVYYTHCSLAGRLKLNVATALESTPRVMRKYMRKSNGESRELLLGANSALQRKLLEVGCIRSEN